MEKEELKQQMMELWKSNFHDSDEYIRLVFDAYFDLDFIEYEEQDGKIIASLLGIPYRFGNENYSINGVYLCGLSTHPKYRGAGVMTKLMHKISKKMHEKGIAFLFLIPANSGLRRYYNDRGFINAFYRSPFYYTSVHDFKKDYFASFAEEERVLQDVKVRYFEGLETYIIKDIEELEKDNQLKRLSEFIIECEKRQRGLALSQTSQQIEIVLKEAIISKGQIVIAVNKNDKTIAGIGFYSLTDSTILEKGRYAVNYGALCKIRERILSSGGERNLTIYQLGYESSVDKDAVWSPMYSSYMLGASQVATVGSVERVYKPSRHAEIYGMVKILSISEILKFMTNARRDLKYSILVRLENEDKIMEFSGKNGRFLQREILLNEECSETKETENKNRKIVNITDREGYSRIVMTERDLGRILFRKPGGDHLVDEAFGIPALNGRISLLLD